MTTAAWLGNDASGNNNYWSPNSIVLNGSNSAYTRVYSTVGGYQWTCPPGVTSVNYLVVGGGGGGGGATGGGATTWAAGGGGGNVVQGTLSVTPGQVYDLSVGYGGAGGYGTGNPGTIGGPSRFGSIVANGGGGGGDGGGASGNGNAGGTNYTAGAYWGAGGGGGAGGTGGNGSSGSAGNGGVGVTSSLSGSTLYYGGGGGGSIYQQGGVGSGGSGVGGTGRNSNGNGNSGTNGRGGGGAGAGATGGAGSSPYTGGSGGSGLVIIQYALADKSLLTFDSTVDVPGISSVPSQKDVGGTVRGNYAVLNPNTRPAGAGGQFTIAHGGLAVTSMSYVGPDSTIAVSSGKWYWEVSPTGGTSAYNPRIGIVPANHGTYSGTSVGDPAQTYGYASTGQKGSGGTYSNYGDAYSDTDNNTIGVALDLDNYKIWFSKNGVWQAGGDPEAGTNPAYDNIVPDEYVATVGTGSNGGGFSCHFNFGQRPFVFAPPNGFKSINTTNLPDPIIKTPSEHFDIKTYTGNGNSLIVGTTAKQTSAYTIPKSVRFRRGSSTYLNRTPITAGNQQKFTFSTWYKRSSLDNAYLFTAGTTSTNRFQIDFYNNRLEVSMNNGSWVIDLLSSQIFVETTSWHHLVVAVDTTSLSTTQRVRAYVDGREIVNWNNTTWPSQNLSTPVNSKVEHTIGQSKTAGNFFDGYMAEMYLVDGQQLTPSSFGTFDALNNWVPQEYTGTYGTNGFYLPFDDASRSDSAQWMPLTYGPGLGNWTVVNKFNQIPAGTVVDSIGYYNNSADTGSQYYIVRYDGGTSYTKVAQTDIGDHPGTGLIYRPLSGGSYTIPSSGTYYLAGWFPGSGLNWGHDSNSSTSWHYYNGSINSVSGSTAWTSYSAAYKEPALLYATNAGVTKDASGNLNIWSNTNNEGAIRANDGTYDITVTENNGTTAPTNTNNGAFGSIALNNTHSSLPSASNEYLIVTVSPAKPITQELKFYFDVNATWKNGRNLYINGTEVNTANVSVRSWNGMQEWTINLAAEGITQLSSFTTPQNSGGRCSLFAVVIDGNSLIDPRKSDTVLDSPTDIIDTNGNIVGNYPTMNAATASNTSIMSDAALTVTAVGAAAYFTNSTSPFPTTGKWYAEIITNSYGGPYTPHNFGLSPNSNNSNNGLGIYLNNYGQAGNQNNIAPPSGGATNIQTTGLNYTQNTGDIIQFAYDADTGNAWLGINNSWVGTSLTAYNGDPSTQANPTSTFTAKSQIWLWSAPFGSGTGASFNFGQQKFKYTPPTGFKALTARTLKEIGSYTLPDTFGNFVNTPDLVWTKARTGGAVSPRIYDTVRGPGYSLGSNSSGGQSVETNPGLNAFLPNGFQLYSPNGAAPYGLENGYTYVAWCWNRGKTPGFDIVTYSGDGDNNRMIPHNLGQVPAMYVTKNLDGYNSANSFADWAVWHKSCPTYTGNSRQGKQPLWLMNTNAASNGVGGFYNNPTSTHFGPNQLSYDNVNNKAYIAYLWAEVPGFSKFGTYNGNASTDGAFIYCGFRPRWILMKRRDTASVTYGWLVVDTDRYTGNTSNMPGFWLDAAATENPTAYIGMDILSNGFKLRENNVNYNAAEAYVFAAFAEAPFKYANAR